MKKLILSTFYFLLSTVFCKAQVNIVPNPSFENLSQCPTFFSQLEYAIPWFQPYVDSSGVQQSSTDLFSSCCSGFCGFINNQGSQLPNTGNTYAGIYFYGGSATYREYIEAKLNDSLINNKSYCVKLYASLCDRCNYAASNFGVHFSNDSCLQVIPPDTSISQPAQAINPNSNVITDKINWIPIELEYLAQGGENFITIGGFDPNNIIVIGGGDVNMVYYYIDDVSVIDISTPAYAGVDTTITIGDSVFIGRTPEIGLDDDCVWYANGSPIDTVAGLWVMPDSTTTYILEQTICGYTTYDTVMVTVLPTSINELLNENNVNIYPNPTTNQFVISLNTTEKIGKIELLINDITGKWINNITLECNNNKVVYDKNLDNGVYFVTIKIPETGEYFTQKLTVIK